MLDGPSVARSLKECGVTHVVWVPDSELGSWEPALLAEPSLSLVRVCREGEAITVAGGLLLGGKRPVVLLQCTGFFEAGDAFRNIVHDLKLPLFLVIGVRSYFAHQKGATTDTCPEFIEPIVQAWQLPCTLLDNRHSAADLAAAYRTARGRASGRGASCGVTAMTHREALEILAAHRGDRIVITTMTAVGVWPSLSDTALDFSYIPSAMGHAPGLGLGLALAQPSRGVIVVNGDGSLLMNLGCLVTLANNPADVYMLVMDNGLYEVTGGQPHAGAGHTDYAGLARAAGIHRVYTFDSRETWQAGVAEALSGRGPVLIWLKVEGRLGQKTPKPPRPMNEQIARLCAALGTSFSGRPPGGA